MSVYLTSIKFVKHIVIEDEDFILELDTKSPAIKPGFLLAS
jgi:hypothetical protein